MRIELPTTIKAGEMMPIHQPIQASYLSETGRLSTTALPAQILLVPPLPSWPPANNVVSLYAMANLEPQD